MLNAIKKWLITKMHRISTGKGTYANRFCHFEKPASLESNVLLQNCTVGSYSYVAHDSWLADTEIGRFCSIGPNTIIGPGKHPLDGMLSTSPMFYSSFSYCGDSWIKESLFDPKEAVKIGSDVWIGAGAIILDGCEIGHGAVIAAGAVVNCNVPPYAIYGGVPAKLIRYRFAPSVIADLLSLEWWNKDVSWLKKNAHLFSKADGLEQIINATRRIE